MFHREEKTQLFILHIPNHPEMYSQNLVLISISFYKTCSHFLLIFVSTQSFAILNFKLLQYAAKNIIFGMMQQMIPLMTKFNTLYSPIKVLILNVIIAEINVTTA